MRFVLATLATFLIVSLAGAPEAAAASLQKSSPRAEAASPADNACAPRLAGRGHRQAIGYAPACLQTRGAMRGCDYVIDIRATALRYASNRRRHSNTVRCVVDDRAGANGAGV